MPETRIWSPLKEMATVSYTHLASHGADGTLFPQQAYGGGTAQGYNHFRPDDPDFMQDDGQARFNFFRRGGAVIGSLVGQGRAEFDDVGNVNQMCIRDRGITGSVLIFRGGNLLTLVRILILDLFLRAHATCLLYTSRCV